MCLTYTNASEAVSCKRTIHGQQAAAWEVKGGNTEKQKELRTRILSSGVPSGLATSRLWRGRRSYGLVDGGKKNIRTPREGSLVKNEIGMVRRRAGTWED